MPRIPTAKDVTDMGSSSTPRLRQPNFGPAMSAASRAAGAVAGARAPRINIPGVAAKTLDTSAVTRGMFGLSGAIHKKSEERKQYKENLWIDQVSTKAKEDYMSFLKKESSNPEGLTERLKQFTNEYKESVMGAAPSNDAANRAGSSVSRVFLSNLPQAMGMQVAAERLIDQKKEDTIRNSELNILMNQPLEDIEGMAAAGLRRLEDRRKMGGPGPGHPDYEDAKASIQNLYSARIEGLLANPDETHGNGTYLDYAEQLVDSDTFNSDPDKNMRKKIEFNRRIRSVREQKENEAIRAVIRDGKNYQDNVLGKGKAEAGTFDAVDQIRLLYDNKKDGDAAVEEFELQTEANDVKWQLSAGAAGAPPDRLQEILDEATAAYNEDGITPNANIYNRLRHEGEMLIAEQSRMANERPNLYSMGNPAVAGLWDELGNLDGSSPQYMPKLIEAKEALKSHQLDILKTPPSNVIPLPPSHMHKMAEDLKDLSGDEALQTLLELRTLHADDMPAIFRGLQRLPNSGMDKDKAAGLSYLVDSIETMGIVPLVRQQAKSLGQSRDDLLASKNKLGEHAQVIKKATDQALSTSRIGTELLPAILGGDPMSEHTVEYSKQMMNMLASVVDDRQASGGLTAKAAIKMIEEDLIDNQMGAVDVGPNKFFVSKAAHQPEDIRAYNDVLSVFMFGPDGGRSAYGKPYYGALEAAKGVSVMTIEDLSIDYAKMGRNAKSDFQTADAREKFFFKPTKDGVELKVRGEYGQSNNVYLLGKGGKHDGAPVTLSWQQMKDLDRAYMSASPVVTHPGTTPGAARRAVRYGEVPSAKEHGKMVSDFAREQYRKQTGGQ